MIPQGDHTTHPARWVEIPIFGSVGTYVNCRLSYRNQEPEHEAPGEIRLAREALRGDETVPTLAFT